MRIGWVCALLILAWPASAQTGPAASADAPAIALRVDPLDTPAQAAARKLPKHLLTAKPQKFSEADRTRVDAVTRLDEIIIYGQVEPEDYVGSKKAPIVQFRERLEKDRPLTPREKAQLALCFFGLCGIYGPDGIPREPSLAERNEARTNQSTTQLNSQFGGTLQ